MCHTGNVGPRHQRRFGLTDKHIRRGREGFRVAGAQQFTEPTTENSDHPLHDPGVVQHRDQRTEENHNGQHAEGKNEAE